MTLDEWLDACADNPDDDLTRRAFADWLEESGDADRAQFIRLKLELARHTDRAQAKARQVRALLK